MEVEGTRSLAHPRQRAPPGAGDVREQRPLMQPLPQHGMQYFTAAARITVAASTQPQAMRQNEVFLGQAGLSFHAVVRDVRCDGERACPQLPRRADDYAGDQTWVLVGKGLAASGLTGFWLARRRTTLQSESLVTTPNERTRAVLATRGFLEQVAAGGMRKMPAQNLMREASDLLRHYPSGMDMHLTASAMPSWWAPPVDPRCFTSPEQMHERVAADLYPRRKRKRS